MADRYKIRPITSDEYAQGDRAQIIEGMPVTKITLSTAMRARDVSRPHAEHVAEAARREDAVTRQAETPPPKPSEPAAPTAQSAPAIPKPTPPRRRRRRGR
jgi:hypothetical protein